MAETAGVQFTDRSKPGVMLADPVSPRISPRQMWAARLLLGWSRDRLAGRLGTTATFVWTYENDGRIMKMTSRDQSIDGLAEIRATLADAGVEFIDGDEPRVKLRKVVESE